MRRWTSVVAAVLLAGCGAATGPEKPAADAPLAIDPRIENRFRDGIAAMRAERLSKAEEVFREIVEREPRYFGPHLNLGIIHIRRGEYQQAEKALYRATQLKPASPELHNQYGMLYFHLGRFADADAAFSKAVELRPDYATAHYNLAVLCELYTLDFARALRHYDRYRQLTAGKDIRVENWITDLRKRLKR